MIQFYEFRVGDSPFLARRVRASKKESANQRKTKLAKLEKTTTPQRPLSTTQVDRIKYPIKHSS